MAAADWLADGRKVALGTVVRTWGSAPRQAGSQIAVRDDGALPVRFGVEAAASRAR